MKQLAVLAGLISSLALAATPAVARDWTPPSSAHTPLQVFVPAYWEDPPGPYWTRLEQASSVLPHRLWAILDTSNGSPYDGPPAQFDPAFRAEIKRMHGHTGRVFGYVDTDYMRHDEAGVKADAEKWLSQYHVDGIFFDQSTYDHGHEGYYRRIYRAVKSRHPHVIVMTNPGTNTLRSYLVSHGRRAADVISVFENRSGFEAWRPDRWMTTFDRSNFAILPYNTPVTKWRERIDRSWDENLGWIYVTDNNSDDNPWDSLPPYFESEIRYIRDHYSPGAADR